MTATIVKFTNTKPKGVLVNGKYEFSRPAKNLSSVEASPTLVEAG